MQQVNPSSESSIASKRATFNTLYCLDSVQEEQVPSVNTVYMGLQATMALLGFMTSGLETAFVPAL